jgi:hypothetical protein
MSYFADRQDLEREVVAFATAFLSSDDGFRAREAARASGEPPRVVVHIADPEAVVSVDFFDGSVRPEALPEPSVEIELEADALHDILLGRLDPVQISRLCETGRLSFSGAPTDLAALVVVAGPLQLHYAASLERRGRQDLLATRMPERAVVWTTGPDAPLREIINERRSWQRRGRAASSV